MNNLKDYEKQVNSLMREGKWQEAYTICHKIISFDGENITFIKLLKQIEQEVKKNNQAIINQEIENLEPLLKAKKYEEYLQKISLLQNYLKDFPIINKKIKAAKKLFDINTRNKEKQAFQEQLIVINQLVKTQNFAEASEKIAQFKNLNIYTADLQKLERNIIQKWVDHELKQNKTLLKSEKYEDIITFLLKFKKIDPNNRKINSLIEKVKNSYRLFKIDDKRDFIFKTLDEIKTLYIRKKYEKVLILCKRILEIDEKNALALKYRFNAVKKNRQESTQAVEKQIFTNYEKLQNSQNLSKNNYLVI